MSDIYFIEHAITGSEPARCVDGRPTTDAALGGQMLGGSIHPIFLLSLIKNIPFNEQLIQKTLSFLMSNGYQTGIHRGSLQSKELGTSDCGFADNLPAIFHYAREKKEDILKRLSSVIDIHPALSGKMKDISDTYRILESYDPNHITLSKEKLISCMESTHPNIEHTIGIHKESAAFINLKPQTTLNIHDLHEKGEQAFNLDLWFVIEQAMHLGLSRHNTSGLSLILYQSAITLLMRQAGKSDIPLIIHKQKRIHT